MNNSTLTPRRPYILRAFYDWLVENELTPHLVVNATLPMVDVPQEYVKDGQIVLNIAPRAVVDFVIDNHQVSFSARFGGQPMSIDVPMYAVMAIYARENGAGTMFESESVYELELEELEEKAKHPAPVIGLVNPHVTADADKTDDEATDASTDEAEETESPKPKKGGPPNLKVIK